MALLFVGGIMNALWIAALATFVFARPRLAVSGLNPHAGEEGSLGYEEIDIIQPAVEAARRKDLDVAGPHPADTMFHCARELRRGNLHVSRSGVGSVQDARLRAWRQRHAWASFRAYLSGSWHSVRHRWHRQGQPEKPYRSAPPGGRDEPARGEVRMSTPDGLPPLREVIRAAGLSAKKSLGQNFLLDFNLTRRVARAAGPLEGVTVVEVGPGPGGLTRALLLEGASRVVAIERDQRCLPALSDIAALYPGRLDVVAADAREVDYAGLALRPPARIVANLPYSVATPLLVSWLKTTPWLPWFDKLVLMFQREVAERIVARSGGKDYGRLAVLSQWRTEPRILLTLPGAAFTPKPQVDSALVEFVPKAMPEPPCNVDQLERVTAVAFGQRRKMLRSSLRQLTPDSEKLLVSIAIEPTARAEELPVADFCRIANALAEKRS